MLAGLSMGWIAAAIAGVALPLIAHLLSRRGGRTVVFPAVRFVMRAAAEHARRHRLRDLLLFLMRATAIILIALAFDRPVWIASAEGRPGAGAGRDVVIVLDASASMTRRERGRELYEIARDRAIELLDGLDWSRDRAGVVFVRASAAAALPRLSGNRSALIERVRESRVTLERGDLGAALAMASELPRALDIDESSSRERRIVVIGDRQRTQWESADAPVGGRAQYSGVGPTGPTENLAVTNLDVTPRRAMVGREVVVTATVANFGPGARGPRVVLREPGGRVLGASTPTISPNGRATLSFSVVFDEPGFKPLEAALVDGAFTVDDVGRTVVRVIDGQRLAMVTRSSPGDMRSAAYFFEAALAPNEGSRYVVTRASPDELHNGAFDGMAGVIVVEAGAMPTPAIDVLSRFAQSGGGIAWVVDSDASGAGLLAVTRAAVGADQRVYEQISGLMEIPGGAGMTDLRFGADAGNGSGMQALTGPLEMSLLATTFSTVCSATIAPSAHVLARLESGDPLIVDAPAGNGRIVSVLAALDPGRSTLVKSPVFPVLAGEIIGAITEAQPGAGNAHVGEPVTIELVDSARGVWRDDRGKPARVVDDVPGRIRVGVEPVDEPRFVRVADGNERVVGVAAVGIDGRESDMRTMSDDEIEAILSGEALVGGASGQRGVSPIDRRRPIELWGWLLAAAVLLLGAEGLVAVSRGLGRARSRDRAEGKER